MRRTTLLALALAAVSQVAACSGGHEGHADAGDAVNCATETRDDEFVVGLQKTGTAGALDFQLMTASPAPPARGDNTWVVQVSQMVNGVVGSPVSGASIIVTPFMPDHEHGTPIQAEVTPMATAGQYELSPINLWMPGLWETTLSVTSASGTDKVVYRFCIPS